MNPKQPVMGGRRGDDGFRLAYFGINLSEALEEAWDSAGADSDEPSDLNIVLAEFSRYDALALFCAGVFAPEKILGQQFAETAMCLDKTSSGRGEATFQSSAVDPALDSDMSLGFELQVALMRVSAVLVSQRPLDVDWVGVIPSMRLE